MYWQPYHRWHCYLWIRCRTLACSTIERRHPGIHVGSDDILELNFAICHSRLIGLVRWLLLLGPQDYIHKTLELTFVHLLSGRTLHVNLKHERPSFLQLIYLQQSLLFWCPPCEQHSQGHTWTGKSRCRYRPPVDLQFHINVLPVLWFLGCSLKVFSLSVCRTLWDK